MTEHTWKVTDVAKSAKDPDTLECSGCGTISMRFKGGKCLPIEAVAAALLGKYTAATIPLVPEVCEDTTMTSYTHANPVRSPQTWTKAVCRVLGIASERVDIHTREVGMIEIPIITIDGRPLGLAIYDFVKDEPGKSRFGLVAAIQQEAKLIDTPR